MERGRTHAFFDNQGARLHYEVSGQGEPLVFLHGFGWDMRQWKREVEHFSRSRRVITLDARGHGESSLPAGAVSPDIFWQDVVALLDALDIPTATLCGLSMGGHVAIQTAVNAGARVEGLILIGAICTNRFNSYERLLLPVNRFSQRLMPMSWIAGTIAAALGRLCPEEKPYMREVVGSMDHDVYNRTWKAVTNMESRAGLADITCPTLLLIGDHDTMTGRQQQYMHTHIAGSALVTIQNAGHATNLDNPKQVEQELDRFLAAQVKSISPN